MKKHFLALTLSLIAFSSFAQTGAFVGDWKGTLNVGVELQIVFHFKLTGDQLSATIDSPDQGVYGIACDETTAKENQLDVAIKKIGGSYSGKLVNDSTIEGNFTQGSTFPLNLKKTIEKFELKRPQEPKPPYTYKSEDVEYDNADKSLHYGATLTIPEGNGPFPAVVLITGSGQQDRDETLVGHKPFLVLSDALTKNGIAVLRVDDRGIGKSTGDFKNSTTADFALDVNTSLNYLLTHPEVNKKKLGLIGHSEGGMIAPMVSTSRNDVAFVILLAGPGIKIVELMAEQNAAILKSTGINSSAVDSYQPVYQNILATFIKSTDYTSATEGANQIIDQWAVKTDSAILKALYLKEENDRHKMITELYKAYNTNWFKYFLAFDPQPYLQKMTGKVLALNGEKDVQVLPSSNLAGIEAALKKSKVRSYSGKQLPGLNHLFQHCTKCTIAEYVQIEETFSPAALKEINDWLNKEIK